MGGIARFPDGGCLLEQPVKMIQAFHAIGAQIARGRKT